MGEGHEQSWSCLIRSSEKDRDDKERKRDVIRVQIELFGQGWKTFGRRERKREGGREREEEMVDKKKKKLEWIKQNTRRTKREKSENVKEEKIEASGCVVASSGSRKDNPPPN